MITFENVVDACECMLTHTRKARQDEHINSQSELW